MTIITILCYFCGLTALALEDAYAESVPAAVCDYWTCGVLLLACAQTPANILPLLVLCLPLAVASYCRLGLGSADVCVFAASIAVFSYIPALCMLLLASLLALTHCLLIRTRRLPFIPHLLLASVIVQAVL